MKFHRFGHICIDENHGGALSALTPAGDNPMKKKDYWSPALLLAALEVLSCQQAPLPTLAQSKLVSSTNEDERKREEETTEFQRKRQCMEAGLRVNREYQDSYKDAPSLSFLAPRFAYDKGRNTCVVVVGWVHYDRTGTAFESSAGEIRDSLTNSILYYYFVTSKGQRTGNEAAFRAAETKLFGPYPQMR